MKDNLSNLKLEYQKYKTMLLTIKATDTYLLNFVQKEIKNFLLCKDDARRGRNKIRWVHRNEIRGKQQHG